MKEKFTVSLSTEPLRCTYEIEDYELHEFLSRHKVDASCQFQSLFPGNRAYSARYLENWVGLRSYLFVEVKKKTLPGTKPGGLARGLIITRISYRVSYLMRKGKFWSHTRFLLVSEVLSIPVV